MSYCRWSTDNFACDIYAYQSRDGWVIHVGSRRYVGEIPSVDYCAEPETMAAQLKAQHDHLATCGTEPIGLPLDGLSFHEPTLAAFKARMLELRQHGYQFPDEVIAAIDEEIAETASGIEAVVSEIRRVHPISRAGADETRPRVMPLLESEAFRSFHLQLLGAVMSFAVELGTEMSDPEAAYQAVMVQVADVLATVQAVSRRVHKLPAEDAPGSLALVAFDTAKRVGATKQELIGLFVEQFHSWAVA